MCGLLCGITSSPLLIITSNPHFHANIYIYQRLFSTRLIFFSNIASAYKRMLQEGRTTGATLFRNSYLTLGGYYHRLKVYIWIHFMKSSEVCGLLGNQKDVIYFPNALTHGFQCPPPFFFPSLTCW